MNASPSNNSGVPAVIREWIPATFLAAHPATVESAWAFAESFGYLIWIVGGAFWAAAKTIGADHWPLILTFAAHFDWLTTAIGVGIPAVRAWRAFHKAKMA